LRCEAPLSTIQKTRLAEAYGSTCITWSTSAVNGLMPVVASHRNWAAAARLSDAHPNAQMVHLPVHASWLNQVEVYFSVIQRKLLTPDDFEDLDELAAQILAFEKHYNSAARPFDWKFTRTDLNRLLARISQHDRHAPHPLTT